MARREQREWLSGLGHYEQIERFPVQTPLDTGLGLGTQSWHEAYIDLWVERR